MLKLVVIQIVVTTLTDRFYSNSLWCVGIFMVWSEPPECIRYIAIYILSCRVHSIYDLPINLWYIYKRVSPLLFTHLFQRDRFKEREVRFYIAEVILALQHLHKVRRDQMLMEWKLRQIKHWEWLKFNHWIDGVFGLLLSLVLKEIQLAE